jgi:hypothetical protein
MGEIMNNLSIENLVSKLKHGVAALLRSLAEYAAPDQFADGLKDLIESGKIDLLTN